MSLTLFQVDAFTDQLFRGNPAAVVPLQEWLPDRLLQAIAQENNLSETAYFVPRGEGFHLRWFTPVTEVDFCGHATLATSHVLFRHLGFQEETVHFQTRVGRISVQPAEEGYAMDAPADELHEIDIPHELIDALGEAPRSLARGREDLMAVLESEEQVAHLRPDFQLVARLTQRGLLVTAPGREVDFVSRCFFPNAGINEDPVTGSAHATLAPYWGRVLGKKELRARQLSARGGELRCRVDGSRVGLIGSAVTYLKGELYLPA